MTSKNKTLIVALAFILAVSGGAILRISYSSFKVPENMDINKEMEVTKEIPFKHAYWSDILVFDANNTFYRKSMPNQTGKITTSLAETVTVKWDKWGEETFARQPNGSYVYQAPAQK